VHAAQFDALIIKTVSKRILQDVLKGSASPALNVTLLNAGAAIKVSGKVDSIWDGIKLARESVFSGSAMEKLKKLKEFTNSVKMEKDV